MRYLPVITPGQPFPPIELTWGPADPVPGLLCAGADLEVATLVAAYRHGIFPWYSEGQPILWWSPDPRMVLQVKCFRRHRSLMQAIKRFNAAPSCAVRMDTCFADVMAACANSRSSTWISPQMQSAYCRLHEAGFAHSVEVWDGADLIGGLYFTQINKAVFGESMFSRRTDASKIALAHMVDWCRDQGIAWIDCQQETSHLASLGATPIARGDFLRLLAQGVNAKREEI